VTYTHGHDDAVLRSHRWRTVANSAAYLVDRLRPGMSVLDVGCGPGSLTIDLARHVAPGRVVGIDAAAGVLDEARAAAEAAGVANVEFHEGDAYNLAYDQASFDVVHAHQVLQHLERPVVALQEMARVCKASGLVAARDGDYAAFTWYPEEPALARWLEVYRAVARANGGEPDAGRRLKSWARQAGLGEVVGSGSAWCFSGLDERTWWADLWADRISSTQLADRVVELGLATPDELGQIADAWRRWAHHEDAWFAVLHGEILAEV
jgi:2-polyprenyl-3-methyl-5-hydroxy-6-metoxy-1,4-benzoquinol methylase